MSRLARRYARAAFAVTRAAGSGQTDIVAQELHLVGAAYAASDAMRTVFASPTARPAHAGLIAALASHLGVSKLTTRVLDVLVENRRLPLVADVAVALEALADEAAGRQRAVVQTAVPLDAAQSGRIAEALGRRLGRPVALTVQVDPELKGGLVCHVGALTWDSSLRRQLEIVAERLGVHAL